MGNTQCCHIQDLKNKQFGYKEIIHKKEIEIVQHQNDPQTQPNIPKEITKGNRNGLPNQKNYITVSSALQKKSIEEEMKMSVKQLLEIYKKNQRKFKNLLKLERIKQNQLSQAYLLLKQNYGIYIGEWVWNTQLNQNVPEGVGRLYENDYISEGKILTFQQNQFLEQPTIQQNHEQKNEIKSGRRITTIDQYGRKYNQLELYQGQFCKGKYHGVGKYQIGEKKHKQILAQYKQQLMSRKEKQSLKTITQTQPLQTQKKNQSIQKQFSKKSSTIVQKSKVNKKKQKKIPFGEEITIIAHYLYQGQWEQNHRNGKGVQKVKNLIFVDESSNYKLDGFEYSGDYVKDKRTGRGKFIPYLNSQKKMKVDQDIIKVETQKKERQIQLKEQYQFQLKEKQRLYNLWNNYLDEKKYDWQPQFRKKLTLRPNIFKNEQYVKARHGRSFYEENYQGQFKDDNFHGQGTYVWHNGRIYDGEWQDGKMHGIGKFLWPNNISYQGQYKNGLRHGCGIIIWNSYKIWRGSWAFGLRHGYGESISLKKLDNGSIEIILKFQMWNKNLPKQTIFETKQMMRTTQEMIFQITNRQNEIIEDQIQLQDIDKSEVASVAVFKKKLESDKESELYKKQEVDYDDQFLGLDHQKNKKSKQINFN